jgi:hypothetical protein
MLKQDIATGSTSKRSRGFRPTEHSRRVGMAVAATATTALCVAIAAPAEAKQANNRCGFAVIIGVRGSTEPAGTGTANDGRTYASGGLGPTINNLTAGALGDKTIPFWIEGLNYPAVMLDPNNKQAPSYIASLNKGVTNLRGEIEDLANSCPSTNIILGGFSQGAHVISSTLDETYMPLSASAKNHISAVALFGSPTFHAGESINASGSGPSNGIFGLSGTPALANYKRLAWNSSYTSQSLQPIVRSYCLSGDFFCQTNLTQNGLNIHQTYPTSPTMLAAWSFIHGWIADND